jgi:nucleoid DNA-binding protein
MTKAEIIVRVYEKAGIAKKDSTELVEVASARSELNLHR